MEEKSDVMGVNEEREGIVLFKKKKGKRKIIIIFMIIIIIINYKFSLGLCATSHHLLPQQKKNPSHAEAFFSVSHLPRPAEVRRSLLVPSHFRQ